MPRDVYTADMGQPPSPDEGAPPKRMRKRRPISDVYVAEMGQPPSPDEGPTARTPRPMPRPMPRPASGTRPFAEGGKVGSASKRADGIAQRGKTKGRMI